MDAVDVVEAQLAAYNARDVEGFVRCYTDPVPWRGPEGVTQVRTREQLRASFGALFAQSPELHARVTRRTVLGTWVIDLEEVSGLLGRDVSAVLVHRVVDGLIVEVMVLTDHT